MSGLMKTKISNFVTGILVNAYMAFTVVAILFEKTKKKKPEKTKGSGLSHASASMSKG